MIRNLSRHHIFVTYDQTVSGGTVLFQQTSARGQTQLMGPQVQAGRDIVFDGGTVGVTGMRATDVRDSSHRSGGWLSKRTVKEHTETAVLQAAALKADRAVKFSARTLKGQLDGVRVQAETLLNQAHQGLVAAPLVGLSSQVVESSQSSLLSGSKAKQNVGQEVMVATTLDVDTIVTLGAKLKLISAKLGNRTKVVGQYEEEVRKLASWNESQVESTGLPAPMLMVGALAFTIATGGTGSGLYAAIQGCLAGTAGGGAVATAAFTTLCSQMGASVIANGGNVQAAVKSTFSKDGALALAAQIASTGVLDKMGISMPNANTSVAQIADYSARKVLINGGMNVAIGRESASEAFRGAGVNFIADVVGTIGANKIGSLYNNGEGSIDFTIHKFAHAGLGAGLGALKGDIAAGAIGGMVAEIVTDMTRDDVEIIRDRAMEIANAEGVSYGSDDFKAIVREQVQATMNWGKIGGAVAAALVGRNVNIALDTATNAVENNFAPMIIGGVLVATGVAISAYEVNKAYQEGGAIAAAEQLGVEIAWGVAGGVAGKAVGKAIYKYGDTVCATLKEAVNLALKDQPGMRLALGAVGANISHAVEKVGDSAVVQFLQKAEHKAEVFYGKVSGKAASSSSAGASSSSGTSSYILEVDGANKGLYNSHAIRDTLESRYPGNVTSSTVPLLSQKNVKLAGQRHPETGIVFDSKGFPIFDGVAKFDTRIPHEIAVKDSRIIHMKTATKQLRVSIKNGEVNKNNFTFEQLQQIKIGRPKGSIPPVLQPFSILLFHGFSLRKTLHFF